MEGVGEEESRWFVWISFPSDVVADNHCGVTLVWRDCCVLLDVTVVVVGE